MMVLEGIRVIDWTIFQAGPVASEMLGDLGAEVIKVEQRGKGDPGRAVIAIYGVNVKLAGDRNAYFESNNRSKKAITLDLSKPKAVEAIYRLVEKSDVFLHNYRMGVAEKHKLDYETLHKINPRLIYAQLTGLGEKGPENHRPTFDSVGIFRSGFALAGDLPDGKPFIPAGGIADQLNGWSLAYGVLAAIIARDRYGVGQKVTSSFLNSMMWLQGMALGGYLYTGVAPGRIFKNALARHYQCADGKWLTLANWQFYRHWADFCKATGLTHLQDDPRFADPFVRTDNHEILAAILEEVFASKTWPEWKEIFSQFPDFVYEGAQMLTDLVNDPQVIANDYLLDYDHPTVGKIKMLAPPVKLSETPAGVKLPPPEFGQHTEEVLMEVCGYTWEELEKMREDEVI